MQLLLHSAIPGPSTELMAKNGRDARAVEGIKMYITSGPTQMPNPDFMRRFVLIFGNNSVIQSREWSNY
jgi:hypothetical protein